MYKYPKSIHNLLKRGNPEEIRVLFLINDKTKIEDIYKKCYLFIHYFFPDFFTKEECKAHNDIIKEICNLEVGIYKSLLVAGFRGLGKTSIAKMITVFFLLNNNRKDRGKYYKVVSKDDDNSRQFTTDVYNLMMNPILKRVYSDLWTKSDLKIVDRQDEFDLANGVKVKASTVDRTQRGKLQMASRPDRIIFEDIEDNASVRSRLTTENIKDVLDEAYTSLSDNGRALYNVNYISRLGNVHRLVLRSLASPNYHKSLMIPIYDPITKEPTWFHTKEEIEQIKKDVENFEGDMMCNPSGSSDSYFNQDYIEATKPRPPLFSHGGWQYFSMYNPEHIYVLGADPAGGNGGDYSTISVIDLTVGELVAHFYDRYTNEQKFGDIISDKGKLYGNALVGVERNNHGGAVLLQLRHNNYSNIYEEVSKETYDDNQTQKLGFLTTAQSKPMILSELSKAINNFELRIPSAIMRKELILFPREYVDIKKIDPNLGHFDGVMSIAIAWEMRKYVGQVNNKELIVS